ncbi:MAG TPA: peptidoglycan DD-metalloendopeptidase family protein [Xanthobacteraceae bacterium]|nr:peptidoglycan DD-metalloendopeptidase family protein [Xanthobacteraceae bacterium]
MTYRFKSRTYRADSGRIVDPRKAKRPARRTPDYTFGHGGRMLRFGPVTFWIAVGTVVIMAGWSLATGTYFAFRDDVITRLIARQADLQSAYEDRIAELRTQVDRLTSRQLLDQEKIEHRLEQILRRQSVLESRTSSMIGLPDLTVTGSIRLAPLRGPQTETAPTEKPSPISDTVIFTAPPDREARLESRAPQLPAMRRDAATTGNSVEARLARLQEALDRIEARQNLVLNAIEENYDSKAKRLRSVLVDLGINPGRVPSTSAAVGGPFVPAPAADSGAFERQLNRISVARAHVERMIRTLNNVPVRKPINGEIDLSSGFGLRMDPFVRAMAMHTGVDFRSNSGDPVRATANGTVTLAGWNGGYGRMVEIDHGNGISTRYGHLSEILVKPGQSVRSGQIVGRVGSTGRSTGPHLHYETRVEGEAVNPQKFLRAGLRLGNI